MWTTDQIDSLEIHFLMCTERTGSSLLTTMLNMHPELIVPSEEPFALYFHKKYKYKTLWKDSDLEIFVDEFFCLFEKNIDLYFEAKNKFINSLQEFGPHISYEQLIKLCYLHFYDSDIKPKDGIRFIIDKQMKYVYHLGRLRSIFPSAKYIILTRNVLSNITAKKDRKIDFFQHPYYLAAIWKKTFSLCLKIPKDQRILIRYEDLILNPREVIQNINKYIGVSFSETQLNYKDAFQQLIALKKEKLDPTFVHHLNNFHKGLSMDIDPSKINQGKGILPSKIENTIIFNTSELSEKLAYLNPLTHSISKFESVKWLYYSMLTWIFRTQLWRWYLQLPLQCKIYFRKLRSKHPSGV